MRKWGSWVSEIRMPKTRDKIWLGSYKTAEQAARAYDAAVYCLRGPNAQFNFPDSVPAIPSASSLSRQQIQVAAAKYAFDEIPPTSLSLQNITNNKNKAREKSPSPSRPSSVSETEWACDSRQISKAQDLGLLETPFDGNGGLNLEKIPSIEEASVLEFIPTLQEGQQEAYIFFDPTDLWNF
jgi:hypothetical protein